MKYTIRIINVILCISLVGCEAKSDVTLPKRQLFILKGEMYYADK